LQPTRARETVTKSDREIMEILESYDLTRCAHSAALLAGCDAKTVNRYVALRDAGGGDRLLVRSGPRPKLIDAFLRKVEELGGRCVRRRTCGGPGGGARTGRGWPSRACGCSSTGVVRREVAHSEWSRRLEAGECRVRNGTA
jgi:hypothetical protein